MQIIQTKAYARAGLIGNPSDGYFGKTISVIIKNFSAKITLYEWPELEIVLSKQDRCQFNKLDDLVEDVKLNGYYGGLRLIKASIKKFYDYCSKNKLNLHNKNFSLRYESNIPRQVGLAGSSAMITATIRALMKFYNVSIPKEIQPNIILSAETEELGISAGLQDRVCQVYEGAVYMDFDRKIMEENGHGYYEPINPDLLPPLFIAYSQNLSEVSGISHGIIKQKFLDGDKEIVTTMSNIAKLAKEAKDTLLAEKPYELGKLIDKNFEEREKLIKTHHQNAEMVNIARSLGAHAKLAGSGGSIIGMYENEKTYDKLMDAYIKSGYNIFKPKVE